MRAALLCHAQHRLDEAQALYRQVLALNPQHARALGMLALALCDGPEPEAAEPVLLDHLSLCPDDGASLHRLGRLRTRQGRDEAAAGLLARAVLALPNLAPIHNDLGVALHRLGRREEALAALDRAVALDGAYAVAHGNRGGTLLDLERFGEATDAQLRALAHAPPEAGPDRAMILHGLYEAARKADLLGDAERVLWAELDAGRDDTDTVVKLATILHQSGRGPEALRLRNALARRLGLHRAGTARSGAATVLVLAGAAGGLAPTRYLLDTGTFATLSLILLTADQPDAPLGAVEMDGARDADVVFSVLADVDHDSGQFDAAIAFCEALGKPVLNPPRSIRRTGRDHAAELFAGIPAMVTPKVRYAEADDLAALPITAPVLVRPVGDHGGDNLVLLRTEADKTAYLERAPQGRVLLSPFHDFRSPDGHWRKYRFVFVDRRVHPYHLAIGEQWLVHYWRAEMQRSPWKMAEEERFLDDWRGVFGPRAAAATEEAARRLDLDYGGMDCALTREGELLLFEANACILLHLDEPAETFAYKHRHTPPIREAFTRMVLERAGRG
jgi:tetratricopeptide (TPR) repeat protein